jgi:hypothetical protein
MYKDSMDPVSNVSFSPDGARLISVFDTGALVTWDLNTHKRLPVYQGVAVRSGSARSPNGRFFASVNGTVIHHFDTRLSAEELERRGRVTLPDPAWHAAEAQRFGKAAD